MADPVVLQKYSEDLHQVLKDLTGLAKLGSAPLNTYQAAVRNSDELLKQIERESTERKLLEQIERESREE